MNKKILIIDDEPLIRMSLEEGLKSDALYLKTARTGKEALDFLNSEFFDVVITDIKLPDFNGMEILKYVKENSPETTVIIITAYGTDDMVVEALKNGAFDYITKPFSIDEIKIILNRAEKINELEKENKLLKEQITRPQQVEIIGTTREIVNIKNTILTVAQSDSPVLITGETGTGKELIADAIHYASRRKDFPFIKINCSAIPETLLESELFGYEKGAFTGAYQQKKGKIELANNGTLFLDEIGDMHISIQAKLLRVLETKYIDRLGGTTSHKVDIRIIVATKKNLKEEIRKGNFREDLFYRINVFNFHLPPLRERRDDIPILSYHFLQQYSKNTNKKITKISEDTLDILYNYDFPGNIRELKNIIERAVMLCPDGVIYPSLLPHEMREKNAKLKLCSNNFTLKNALENCERETILNALIKEKWKKSKAAELLAISRKALWEKIKKYDIKPPDDNL